MSDAPFGINGSVPPVTSPWSYNYERIPVERGEKCVECGNPASYARTATNGASGAVDVQYRCTSHQARWCAEHGIAFPKLCRVEVR